ncbi:unnamed protein product [Kuraishia capsulata CBS 1993]|uniref:Uncharacterized protein n=1 Tax=Kuraishia capsulata CBS 1993 TaxID=1382522 RepID=W6MFN0_9ASCO|nr:uncharacterized protein KUCA_T00000383001 [Kuraishia capsulata CBS 1993]CDK24421.1 unnamed protein product [Kuraishia capsulata CBS 1993]
MGVLTIDKPRNRIRDSVLVKFHFYVLVVGICISLFFLCVYPYTFDHGSNSTLQATPLGDDQHSSLGKSSWRIILVQSVFSIFRLLTNAAKYQYVMIIGLKIRVMQLSAKKVTLIVEHDSESKSNEIVDVKERLPTWSAVKVAGGFLAAVTLIFGFMSSLGKSSGWRFD